jgi:O-antigen ligase
MMRWPSCLSALFAICLSASFLIPAPSSVSVTLGSWILVVLCFAVFCCFGLAVGQIASMGWLKHEKLFPFVSISAACGWLFAACLSASIGFAQFTGSTGWAQGWIAPSLDYEVFGNLRQRNHLATLLVMGMASAWYLVTVLQPKMLQGKSLPLLGAAICLAIGLALTSSRTGAVQLLALSAYVSLHKSSRENRHLTRGLAFAALGFIFTSVVLVCFSTDPQASGILGRIHDGNAFSRVSVWSNVMELIAQKPWMGHGWRSLAYAHYSSDFSSSRFMEMLDNAHNLPLHLAVELGLPVALGFCGLVGWLIWRNKPWVEAQPERQLAWGVLLIIGIHSMLEYPLWYGPFFMTAVICIGILCGDSWWNFHEKLLTAGKQSARNAIILGVRALAVVLLAVTAFVVFDYHRVSQIYLQPDQRSAWYAADPLGAAKQSVFFKSHAKFDELQITALTKETAPRILELSSELVHWSPEPRIIEKLIESSVMMELDDVATFHLKRYRVAFPHVYAKWHPPR